MRLCFSVVFTVWCGVVTLFVFHAGRCFFYIFFVNFGEVFFCVYERIK